MLDKATAAECGIFNKAYIAQCAAAESPSSAVTAPQGHGLTLFALALGGFVIGTSEFASMGVIQLVSRGLGVDLPAATYAITAYAVGVVVGAPLLTLAAARLNRRTVLLCLMGWFIAGNLFSAIAPSLEMLTVARFINGLPHGAYFGAGAVVASHFVGRGQGGKAFALVLLGLTLATIVGSPLATFLGQNLGWRNTYIAVASGGALALAALWIWLPRTDALRGGPVMQELRALRKPTVWAMMTVAAIGAASLFAVYTFIGPFVTDVAVLGPIWVPVALALFGIGMTVGNLIGGRLADRYAYRGLVIGYGCALIVLAVLALFGAHTWVLMATLFGVGATMLIAVPTIQVRLIAFAPEAPTLMGAMNQASLNVANAIGAWAGGVTVGAGFGLLSAVWAGFALTLVGLVAFALAVPKASQPISPNPSFTQKRMLR